MREYLKHKSRLIIQTLRDPELLNVHHEAPCPENCELMYILQEAVKERWRPLLADVKAAFTQRDLRIQENQRSDPVIVALPAGGLPGLQENCKYVKLTKKLYGLVTGPSMEKHNP